MTAMILRRLFGAGSNELSFGMQSSRNVCPSYFIRVIRLLGIYFRWRLIGRMLESWMCTFFMFIYRKDWKFLDEVGRDSLERIQLFWKYGRKAVDMKKLQFIVFTGWESLNCIELLRKFYVFQMENIMWFIEMFIVHRPMCGICTHVFFVENVRFFFAMANVTDNISCDIY